MENSEQQNKIEVYSEKAESNAAGFEPADVRAAALAYAKYLAENGLEPGDATFIEPEEIGIKSSDEGTEAEETKSEEEKPKFQIRPRPRKMRTFKVKPYERSFRGIGFLSALVDLGDKVRGRLDSEAGELGKSFARETHKIISGYSNTRRSIGISLLLISIACLAVLIVFDRFTVYEYAYNGKVLGYVKEQDEVTEVLDIAGQKLSENTSSSLDIEFKPNQNVTFNMVDSRNKSLDNSDIAVNKLVYMTDIETEAYGIYDGDSLVAIVRNNEAAENLLNDTKEELSKTDKGMSLVSSEFDNALNIKPMNVLLTSVQDNTSAREQMVNGGEMQVYHIVEEGETVESLSQDYSTDAANIYNESNSEVASEVEKGDKVCIHKVVEPLNVTMVERGRLTEVVEYKTIKKETADYYKGDTLVEQEGRNGSQIFEGTITKTAGRVTSRNGEIVGVSRKVRDKIILVGTAERPKTAATGTYAMPIDRYTFTSPYAYRWGRMHTGVDLAAPVGTPIYATDGGTVIRAGYYGGYGNCIDIEHESGRVTRYGHCSKLLVSVGEKVYQRQQIALCGSTGNSTGPHLHFEVILNGSTVDPAPKLGL